MPHGQTRYADRSRSRLAKRANAKVGAKPIPKTEVIEPKAPEPTVEEKPIAEQDNTKPQLKPSESTTEATSDDLGKLNT